MVALGQSNQASFMRPISQRQRPRGGHARATAGARPGSGTREITDDWRRLCALVRMTVAFRPRPAAARAR